MAYGRRVIGQKGKKTAFSFEAHTDVVGEIRLEKSPSDNICNACQANGFMKSNRTHGPYVPLKELGSTKPM
jgi:hypothetical protein